MTDDWVWKFVCGQILNTCNDQLKFAAKILKQIILLMNFQ